MKYYPVFRSVLALMLAIALCLCLVGCSQGKGQDKDAVPVQAVSMLIGMDLSGVNRYCGVAEPKSTEKVRKDSNKDVDKVKVKVGQEVKAGDVLFTYDLESVRLGVESAQLEVEQLSNSITSYEQQIRELEKDKKRAGSGEKLSYSLQIQETMLDKAEAEYNLKKKEKELAKLQQSAKKTKVRSKVDGVVQSINESGISRDSDDDESGSGETFMTIVETGAYRVKGVANETNISALYQEMPVTVYSRTDYTKQWQGTISEIDTGSVEKDNDDADAYGGGDDDSESSSRYGFYVQLDHSDGMMMGQHVYIIPGSFAQEDGIRLNASFVEQEGDQAYVWAAGTKDTLERRAVTLGEYDESADSYLISDGLGLEDYIALPAPGLEEGQKVVKYDSESLEEGDGSAYGEMSAWGESEYGEADGSAEFYDGGDWDSSAVGEEFDEPGAAAAFMAG